MAAVISITLVLCLPGLVRAQADAYPAGPIRLVVPFTAGGIVDIAARSVGQRLAEDLGRPVVIDNRPGAGGNIAAEHVARAPADGYTLLMGFIGSHAVNATLYKSLPYDPVRDFQPISLVASAPLILIAHPGVPADSVAELIAYAKANPGKLNYASSGSGSASHIAMALFASMAAIEVQHVPYKGTAPAQADLLNGSVQLYFDAQITGLAHLQSGKTRGLGVASRQRLPALPALAPLSDTVPGFEFSTWFGVLAPAGLAPARLARLNQGVRRSLQDAAVLAGFARQGLLPMPSTPEEFAAHIASESVRLGRAVRSSGARID